MWSICRGHKKEGIVKFSCKNIKFWQSYVYFSEWLVEGKCCSLFVSFLSKTYQHFFLSGHTIKLPNFVKTQYFWLKISPYLPLYVPTNRPHFVRIEWVYFELQYFLLKYIIKLSWDESREPRQRFFFKFCSEM